MSLASQPDKVHGTVVGKFSYGKWAMWPKQNLEATANVGFLFWKCNFFFFIFINEETESRPPN